MADKVRELAELINYWRRRAVLAEKQLAEARIQLHRAEKEIEALNKEIEPSAEVPYANSKASAMVHGTPEGSAGMNAGNLRQMGVLTAVCSGPKPVAVIIPYQTYMAVQRMHQEAMEQLKELSRLHRESRVQLEELSTKAGRGDT